MEATTNWTLRLKDFVSNEFQKITTYANSAQNKVNDFNRGLNKAAAASNVVGRDFKRNFSQLDNLLDGLKKRMDASFNVKDREAYACSISKITKEMEHMNKVAAPKAHVNHWEHAKEGFMESLNEIPGASGLVGIATNPIALGVAAIGGGLYEASKYALEFEEGMAKVNATAQMSKENLGELGEQIRGIGKNSGGNFDALPAAFDIINKQTKNIDVSLDILKVSTKAAETNLVDMNIAGEATARMAGILGSEYTGAVDVMDTFFSSIKNGNGDINAMMQQLPHLAQLGTGVGLKFKETAGIFNYFTGTMKESSSEAETDMVAMLNTLRSADVIEKFKNADKNLYDKKGHLKRGKISEMSLEMFNKDGTMKSFDKIIRALKLRMDEVSPDMQMNFLKELGVDDNRKAKGILMLMKDVDGLKKSLDAANGSAGALNSAFESSDDAKRAWGDIEDHAKNAGVFLAKPLVEGLEKVLSALDFILF